MVFCTVGGMRTVQLSAMAKKGFKARPGALPNSKILEVRAAMRFTKLGFATKVGTALF